MLFNHTIHKNSKLVRALFVVGIFLFMAGCSSDEVAVPEPKDENIIKIEKVLKCTFTGPNQELKEIWKSIEKAVIEAEEVKDSSVGTITPNHLNQYLAERLKPYFTDEMYHSYISSYALTFVTNAYWNNAELKVKNIDVQTSETKDHIYDFTADVQYQPSGSEAEVSTVTGQANINEDGKIAVILIRANSLMDVIQQ